MAGKGVCLFSGGPDSATTVHWVRKNMGVEQHLLFMDTGHRSAREEHVAAKRIADHLGLMFDVLRVPGLQDAFAIYGRVDMAGSCHGRYASSPKLARFLIGFPLTIGSLYALMIGADNLFIGIHKDDTKLDNEFREESVKSFQETVRVTTGQKNFTIHVPWINKTKAEVLRAGQELGVPFELTWSCLESGDFHCGACRACSLRRQSFQEAGVSDLTQYMMPGETALAATNELSDLRAEVRQLKEALAEATLENRHLKKRAAPGGA